MTYYQYILFTIFVVVVATMMLDQNVGLYITLCVKFLEIKLKRIFWMIKFHPSIFSSPIAKWWMMRKYMREVEKMQKEFLEDNTK